ncbi:MAG: phosphoribosylformylglycinamidine synthase subunit PurL [Planctomycetota bacterium]|nr:phosphoribosylformylglycinamidine synthase subunit PurL [Planctomycetota bacterium]
MTVTRIEVRPISGSKDPRGEAALRQANSAGLSPLPSSIDTTAIYLLEGNLDEHAIQQIAEQLLTDPVTEELYIGAASQQSDSMVEVHPLPGVMDPDAQSVELAISRLLGVDVKVQTGHRYDFHGIDASVAEDITRKCFANTVVHELHCNPYHPEKFPHGHDHDMTVPEILLNNLVGEELEALSREGHLFLDLEEMQTIQAYYRKLGREPREIELETLAQTWSEHCVHKTLKATIRYTGPDSENRPHHELHDDGSVTIHNLLKASVAAATYELIEEGIDWCLSVFVDNAGIIAFDDDHAICFKVETHNHPTAIEPYGGAATGIGGCIRDIMGTGLAARPIAATDVFCVAEFDNEAPSGCLPSRRLLSEVVRGVRDYGNRMGIPTLNGSVWFDNNYAGNPLVYCGCVGVMPINATEGDAQAGDRIIVIGGSTGRDGIHGATFSSAELTDTHADEFSHAVQIGNPITEKKALDAILEARDHISGCLYNAITDCGAGGFSSAVGEMGEKIGATVNLEQAPLKYSGLTPSEIWISEAQERMVLSVEPSKVSLIADICKKHGADMCDLGEFGTSNCALVLKYDDQIVGELDMAFMHDGLPTTTREATWSPPPIDQGSDAATDIQSMLPLLLAHPNIASKQSIVQQYDHEVQGRSVIRPFVGPQGNAPSDAAVITPVRGSSKGLAIGSGIATGLCSDPRTMAMAAIDECVRNIVCVGGDPSRIAILDNFCWPSAKDKESLGRLVRCAHGCYDAAKAYRTPFISGKDSLNNQFTTQSGETIYIPPTLLISGFGIVDDVDSCVTMDAKSAGNLLLLVGETTSAMGGSHFLMIEPNSSCDHSLPVVSLEEGPNIAKKINAAINARYVQSAHDCSEGGLLVAAAEMTFGGKLGLTMQLEGSEDFVPWCFAETPSRYLIEVHPESLDALSVLLGDTKHVVVGTFNDSRKLSLGDYAWSIEELEQSWLEGMVI